MPLEEFRGYACMQPPRSKAGASAEQVPPGKQDLLARIMRIMDCGRFSP